MSDAYPGPILLNCTGGKDKTGIIATLLLSLVEVPAIDMIKNCTDSELFITRFVEQFFEKSRQTSGDIDPYAQMLRCAPETMASATDSISVSHKNIYTYLTGTVLSEVHFT